MPLVAVHELVHRAHLIGELAQDAEEQQPDGHVLILEERVHEGVEVLGDEGEDEDRE